MILRLFKNIWAIYCSLIFISTVLLFFPIYTFVFAIYQNDIADKKIFPISKLWAKILAVLFFVKIDRNKVNLKDKNKPRIYVANHRSMLDIPFSAMLIPQPFRFLAKSSLTKVPIMGSIVKRICIPVDRSNMRNSANSFDLMKKKLEHGSSVLLFPEGTRTKDNLILNEFKNGAFKLAVETQTPIIFLTMWETSSILKKGYFYEMMPGKIHCYISNEFEPGQDYNVLKSDIHSLMKQNLEKYT